MTLNWRHKAGLFVTVVAVGCGLFLDGSAKQAVGIALIGIAFAWLIGSLTPRVLTVAFAIGICVVGLYVAVSPVWSDWKFTKESTAEYNVAIDDLQYAIKTTPALNSTTLPPVPKGYTLDRTITIPESAKKWMRTGNWTEQNTPRQSTAAQVMWDTQDFPATMSDAEIMKALESNLLLPRPTFSLGPAVRTHPWPALGGIALFASGLSILGWLWRRRSTEQAVRSDITEATELQGRSR